jgi:hypothetical protein
MTGRRSVRSRKTDLRYNDEVSVWGQFWRARGRTLMAWATGKANIQITRWVLRTARLRAPATQPMKGAARKRRGTSAAALAVGSGGS